MPYFEVDRLLGSHTAILLPANLSDVCMAIRNVTFPSLSDLVSMTPVGILMDGLPERKAAKLCEGVIQPAGASAPVLKQNDAGVLRICPKCWAEDEKKYGTGYLHLSHNLPGAVCCAKHGIPLLSCQKHSKRDKVVGYDLSEFTPLDVADVRAGTEAARMRDKINRENLGKLLNVTCPDCGRKYAAHPYSEQTGCGCPFCNAGRDVLDIINKRLFVIYNGEYVVRMAAPLMSGMRAVHVPCGEETVRVTDLLYTFQKPPKCMRCLVDPGFLQQKYDPEAEEWLFLETSGDDRRTRKVHVKHLLCGSEFRMTRSQLKNNNSACCPLCGKSWVSGPAKRRINVKTLAPGYEIVGEYERSSDILTFRHEACGFTFRMSKKTFLSGCRCPLCQPAVTFGELKEAVRDCAPGWDVVHVGEKAQVVTGDGKLLKPMTYRKILTDLTRDDPEIFTGRVKRYEEGISPRKRVYDKICEAIHENGSWRISDGLDGKALRGSQWNKVKWLHVHGYLTCDDDGNYGIPEQE